MLRPLASNILSSLLLALPLAAAASPFPLQTELADGTSVGLSANLAWDINHREGDDHASSQAHGWRRQEVGLVARKPGIYDLQVFYDVQNEMWLGVVVGLQSKALLGVDAGRLEIGNIKLAAGLEGVAPTRHMPFLENSAATQVFHPMVRGGLNWSMEREQWMLDAGAYERDIDGFYHGRTQLLRAVWKPTPASGARGHLGLAWIRDVPAQAGPGQPDGGTVRWASRGIASLLPDRLSDSGVLTGVDTVQRQNLQAMWIDGPLWLQGEYFQQQTHRRNPQAGYRSEGGYLSAGWVLNAPPRRIVQGMLMQPALGPGQAGAELVARYSRVDLDDAGIDGGKLGEWTLGGNAYYGAHLKFQANLSQMHLRRNGTHQHVRALQLRTQFFF